MEINTLPIIWFWWIFMQFSSVVSIKNSIFSPFHWKCVFFQYVEKEIIICLSLWLFLSMRKCRYIYWVCPWFDRRISLSVQWKTHWSHWYYNLLPEWKKAKIHCDTSAENGHEQAKIRSMGLAQNTLVFNNGGSVRFLSTCIVYTDFITGQL